MGEIQTLSATHGPERLKWGVSRARWADQTPVPREPHAGRGRPKCSLNVRPA